MLPHVVLHNAASLDGRITGFPIDMKTYYAPVRRWKEDATLVGSGTILAAPSMDAAEDDEAFAPPEESPGDKRPLLVVPDSRGRVRCWHALRKAGFWRDVVALCSRGTPRRYFDYLKKRHIDCIVAGNDHVDMRSALRRLNHRFGVKVVRADSGGTLNGVLLRAGLVSEISILVHPCLVGRLSPKSLFHDAALAGSRGVIDLKLSQVEKLKGGLVWLRYRVV